MINITLPDGTIKKVANNTKVIDIAKSISEGLARNVLAAEINNEIVEVDFCIKNDCTLNLLTWNSVGGKKVMWHSSAHLMAEALEALYPGIKFAIGPPIENGFYYDIDFENHNISSDDFSKIEKKILELAREKNKFTKEYVSKSDAISFYKKKENNYKLELIKELNDDEITFYTQGNFTDLCKGPHIPNTGFIKAVKLINIAGILER